MSAKKLLLTVVGGLALAGCGGIFGRADTQTLPLIAVSGVPAAQGDVKVTRGKGNNMVELKVSHLAAPDRVTPGATAYVVWLQPRQAGASIQNLGVLKLDEDLKGELKALTPFQEFDVFVTAEPSPQVTSPTKQRVLSASVGRTNSGTF